MTEFERYHPKKLSIQSEIEADIHHINAEINGCGFYFQLDHLTKAGYTSYRQDEIPVDALIVIASFDFSYYHQLEMVFYEVKSHTLWPEGTWPDHWEKNQLELDNRLTDDGYFRFLFNRGSHGDYQHVIEAKGLSYNFGTVLYHNDASLKGLRNPRLAWWVH